MLLDARSVPTGAIIETEVCIVGAGAAGITLARGNSQPLASALSCSKAAIPIWSRKRRSCTPVAIGRPYFDPRFHRLRFFGGTTNHWFGRCALPDPIDFETREGTLRQSHMRCWGSQIRKEASAAMTSGDSARAAMLPRSTATPPRLRETR
jgi:hypothetical protein